MPSTVGAQVSRKAGRAAAELGRAPRAGITKGSLLLKRSVEANLPASRRLRGVGKRGARVGVRYDVRSAGHRASSLIRATGPLHLLENDTSAHTVAPKTRGRGANRRQRAGAIRLADGSYRRSVRHPGTKGQKPFAKGIERARPLAIKAMRDTSVDAVKKGLRA